MTLAFPGAGPNLSLINNKSSHGDIYKFNFNCAPRGADYAGSLNASPRCNIAQHMRAQQPTHPGIALSDAPTFSLAG
jgi:hypothetical protein